jgi:hypothetical protein
MADLRMHCIAVAGVGAATTATSTSSGGSSATWTWCTPRAAVIWRCRHRTWLPARRSHCPRPADLHRAAALMADHEAMHIVVVGRTGLPLGVVATLDMLRIVAAGCARAARL